MQAPAQIRRKIHVDLRFSTEVVGYLAETVRDGVASDDLE